MRDITSQERDLKNSPVQTSRPVLFLFLRFSNNFASKFVMLRFISELDRLFYIPME